MNSFVTLYEWDERKLKELNVYPLRVELFQSTYTRTFLKEPKSVDDFNGPDADVVRVTRSILNSTSMYDLEQIL